VAGDASDRRRTANKLVALRNRPVEAWKVESLIELSRDAADEVRDWATFALATRDDDCEEVSAALLERVNDTDLDTRSEALWGLARRQDLRALSPLCAALESDLVGELLIEAAGFFARPELVQSLEALLQDSDDDLIAEALARCRSEDRSTGGRWDYVPGRMTRPSR
jgi:HEAT repeat protein